MARIERKDKAMKKTILPPPVPPTIPAIQVFIAVTAQMDGNRVFVARGMHDRIISLADESELQPIMDAYPCIEKMLEAGEVKSEDG